MAPNMLTHLLTTLVAAGVCAAAVAPFALEWLLTRRGSSRLRLAEQRVEEQQAGFVSVGPVRRAALGDVLDAERRIACTAWRARVVSRPRNCRARREAQRAWRALAETPTRRHPRHCAPRTPAAWWPAAPPARRTPKGLTPLQAVVAELREVAS